MKNNRWILCLVTLLVVVLCVAMIAACDDDSDGSGASGSVEKCQVTFAGVKTTVVEVEKGQKVSRPEAEQKKSGYTFVGWYLGRSLYDFDTPVNEDIVLEAKFERDVFDIAHGVVFGRNGGYMSGSTDSLMVFNDKTFSGGTFTASVTPGIANDCGVVFGLPDDRSSTFWEDEHYYCAIINKDGIFILAEVIPGSDRVWNELASSDEFSEEYFPTDTYTFEVSYAPTSDPLFGYCEIKLNGVKVASLGIDALPGSGVGYRAQSDGVMFSALTVDADAVPDYSSVAVSGDFSVKQGALSKNNDNGYVSGNQNTLAIYKDEVPSSGNYSVSVTLEKSAGKHDDGIVFGLTDNGLSKFWENSGVSYYFFFISQDNTAYLGKVTGGEAQSWHELGVDPLPSVEASYELKVDVENGVVKCYVDDVLYITYTDEDALSGNKVGIRAGGKDCVYSDFTVAEINE